MPAIAEQYQKPSEEMYKNNRPIWAVSILDFPMRVTTDEHGNTSEGCEAATIEDQEDG